jgi:hypothetical protein
MPALDTFSAKTADELTPDIKSSLPWIALEEFHAKVASRDTFVVNTIRVGCSDCEAQDDHLPAFQAKMAEAGVQVFNLLVKDGEGKFLSADHLKTAVALGAKGTPCTTLIVDGQIDPAYGLEVKDKAGLRQLADNFISYIPTM